MSEFSTLQGMSIHQTEIIIVFFYYYFFIFYHHVVMYYTVK